MIKELSIEITRKCPNMCVHCSSMSSYSCTELITLGKFKEIIDSALTLGLETVCFSGGEPFLHPNIIEMIDYVYSSGLQSYVYTSGIFVDSNNKRESIAEDVLSQISSKVTKIIINVEASEENTYNKIMGSVGCFQLMKKTIELAVSLGIVVEGHFVPMKYNMDQIESTLRMCSDLGVSKVSFLRLVVHGRALYHKESIVLNDEEYTKIENLLKNIYETNKYPIRIGVPLKGESSDIHCEAANGKINIRYDGKVFPCEVFKNNCVGILSSIEPDSIYRSDFASIYRDSIYLKHVRKMVSDFSCRDCCENCVGQYYMKISEEGK